MGDHSDEESLVLDSNAGNTSDESVDSDENISSDPSQYGSEPEEEGGVAAGVWLPILGEDVGPPDIPFTAVPGPKHCVPQNSRPIDYLNLFITPHFINSIVQEINNYASKWIRNHTEYLQEHKSSRVHKWIKYGQTTPEEFRAFLAICFNMGLNKKPDLKGYWDQSNPSQSAPWFPATMNRDRFQLLLKFLHFANNDTVPEANDPRYKTYKIQLLIDHFNHVFLYHYQPFQDISIDESLVGYKGKTPHLRQYMPNKHHARFGIKLWCLCDASNGYLVKFEVYKGAIDANERGPEGFTHNLCMRLLRTSNLLNRGYHVGLDNYFSSPTLFLELFQQHQTSATGTVRRNRRGLPAAVKKPSNLTNQGVIERRKGPLLAVAFKDGSKTPILLSTSTAGGYGTTRNKRNQEIRKPKCVIKYNSSMGGVDLSDARLYAYLAERRTLKWTTKVAFSLFGRALLNSYILYDQNTQGKKTV